jgi:hypothetical protein
MYNIPTSVYENKDLLEFEAKTVDPNFEQESSQVLQFPVSVVRLSSIKKNKLHGLSPRANYTD